MIKQGVTYYLSLSLERQIVTQQEWNNARYNMQTETIFEHTHQQIAKELYSFPFTREKDQHHNIRC